MRGVRFFNRLEPAGRIAERGNGLERVVSMVIGIADPTSLEIEPINAGGRANACDAGGHREHCLLHRNPKSLTLNLMI